ncbi:O-antigen ligase [Ruminococcus sp.]|uniref:O-antigen ligase family protein n=1 Tax=Ruminococcus sp. TaxID=41978 RepID=UPI00262CA776|nr:O-antigen ligase family protein [Ruminococcus sp.]MDD6990038.1 O-antigen ligase family protein [Ruminococcus sp.]MDY6201093.1 O-antigen ligase family protein [Ruminococcus sp.]
MKNKTFKITLHSLWYIFTATAIAIICVGGYNPYFMNVRSLLSAGLVVCSLVIALFVRKKIIIDMSLGLFIIVGAYMLFSATISMDTQTGFKIAGYYIIGIAVMMIEYSDSLVDTVLKFINVFVLVIAVSILISVPIDDCMNKYFSWLLNPTNSASVAQSMRDTIANSHSYAGFARDKGVAAYIMGMGICIYLAKYFSGKKLLWHEVLGLIIEICALLLTSKRMIIVCLVVVFAVLMLTSQIKGKVMKFAMILLIGAAMLFVITAYIPSLSNVFDRFTNESTDTMTGRGDLWKISLMMFAKSPVIGTGLGSFNKFAAECGYLSDTGEQWNYFGHNCYYEFLGELGIIGSIIVFGTLLYMLVKTILLVRNSSLQPVQRYHVLFALAVEVMLLIYSVTGNVLLYADQTLSLFFAFAITRSIIINNGLRKTPIRKMT